MLAVAQVGFFFPGFPYVSPGWGTRDNTIPWRLFWMLFAELNTCLALQRINFARAQVDAEAMKHSESLPVSLREDIRMAFPWLE